VGFTLTGPLAQFSRSSLVQDIAQRMTAAFAQNLQARLDAQRAGRPDSALSAQVAELNAGSLFLSVVWNRVTAFFRRLVGR
jgi:carbon-monoxide dehydrogenase small subunit